MDGQLFKQIPLLSRCGISVTAFMCNLF